MTGEAEVAVAAAAVVQDRRVLLVLGQRIHPMTGRENHSLACRPGGGETVIMSDDEVRSI
ncbi:hypothetical protein [Streptomyces sp. NPDC004284]|uniref:hypothetical protein n=1 Tax=Streptomyces sp. NPDC004284 TaxID=3364695 RepID=UPI00369B3252